MRRFGVIDDDTEVSVTSPVILAGATGEIAETESSVLDRERGEFYPSEQDPAG